MFPPLAGTSGATFGAANATELANNAVMLSNRFNINFLLVSAGPGGTSQLGAT
jgi:hypothetical protein